MTITYESFWVYEDEWLSIMMAVDSGIYEYKVNGCWMKMDISPPPPKVSNVGDD